MRAFDNGHFEAKSVGDTVFRGTLEPLAIAPPADPRAAAEGVHRDGFVAWPDALDRAEVAELRALMDASGGPDSQYEMKDWCFNKHLDANFETDPRMLKYIDRAGIIEVVEALLGPGCRVIGGSMWVTGKGRAMGMHADALPVKLPADIAADPRVRMPVFSCTCHYYLDDLVEELGPTLLIPGSHRAGHVPHDEPTWNGAAPRMLLFGAGGACLFRHDLWHGAAMNRSDRRRYLVQVHYGTPYLGIWNPPTRAVSPEVLAVATARQRRLLGAPEAPAIGQPKQDPKRAA